MGMFKWWRRERPVKQLRAGVAPDDLFPRIKLQVAGMLSDAADLYGVSKSQILGDNRHPEVVLARWLFITTALEELKVSANRLGGLIGKHHTTVLNARRRVSKMRQDDPTIEDAIQRLKERYRSSIAIRM